MRNYPRNSPQAAARILALTIVSDRDVSSAEFGLLDRLAVHEQLGLERSAFQAVFDTFCQDLIADNQLESATACPVDECTLAALMDEIDSPALQRLVLELCISVAEADDYVAEGESIVLRAAVEHWGMHRHMLQRASSRPALSMA